MTVLEIEAGDLLADASNPRRRTGLLIPYGETGRTNLGRVSVAAGAIELPADPAVVTLNLDHERNQPVGRAAELHATDAGVVVSFDIAKTPEGDDLLAELDDPTRPNRRARLSAEVTNIVIRAGQIVRGKLYGAAATVAGAFPSAELLASDVGDDADDGDEAEDDETPDDAAADPADDDTDPNAAEAEDNEGDDMPTATAPADLAARQTRGRKALEIKTPGDLFAAVARAHRDRNGDLLAALSDITSAAHTPNVTQPQFVGELWDGVAYERQYIPLFNHADLVSWVVRGWRWVVKPEVAKYDGDKTAVPSNLPTTEPVEIEAERIAGGHDIDRKYKDFGDVGFIESYYRAMTESYAEVSDVDVLDQVLAAITPTPVTIPTEAAGVDRSLVAIVQGYFSVFRATRRRPTFARISDTAYERLLWTQRDETLPYLEQMLNVPGGLEAGFMQPSVDLTDEQVFVGVKDAVTVHEMGGGAPIRVDAIDVANGGEDHGVFGYTAVNIHREDGLALIDTTPAGG